MKSNGVLLLSHVGFSFLEDLINVLDARGLRSFVLSSSPLPAQREQRLRDLEKVASRLFSTPTHVLTVEDVERVLAELRASGEEVLCCVSVWEGYRALMAHANARLGIADLSIEQVIGLRDKLALRNRLADAGLSGVRATALTRDNLEVLKRSGERYFIKPRSGIASYGTFPLRPDTSWETLEHIVADAAADTVYSSAFNGALSFLAEGYLPGQEFSFEVMIVDGEVKVAAIHEKCEITETAGAVLENSCTSPPHAIGKQECAQGIAWIGRVAQHLALRWGCFHIEARFDGARWDLIEANPRVGGSLISPSVKALNGECSMLELWVDMLLAQAACETSRYLQRLAALSYSSDGEPPTAAATFFRVYFARPGRIGYVGVRELARAPVVSRILLKAGHEVTETAREVFLGEMLWRLSRKERDAGLPELARLSQDVIEVRYDSDPATGGADTLLIIDYNLTRVEDVAHIASYVRSRYGGKVVLVRAEPSARDRAICDAVVNADPLDQRFVETAAAQLAAWQGRLRAGIVFSDNAVQSGAALLERLGLPVDCSELALGAFSKHAYRLSEVRHGELFAAQHVMVPECAAVKSLADLQRFAERHPDGFVVKPSCEGNNRGVVMARAADDLEAVFDEVAKYLPGGVICEQMIPYRREYSYDGIGMFSFITEKVTASGRYPVEIAQIQPARLSETERTTLVRAGRLANLLVGQRDGPFHNEIKLSDDGMHAAVVEPNRRPGGMKIWSLAGWVYGIDLYQRWIDSVFGVPLTQVTPNPTVTAATVMLGVGRDRVFAPDEVDVNDTPIADALAATAEVYGLSQNELRVQEFGWVSLQCRLLRKIPRDNADFAAYVCILLDSPRADIRDVIVTLRQKWVSAFEGWYDPGMREPAVTLQMQTS